MVYQLVSYQRTQSSVHRPQRNESPSSARLCSHNYVWPPTTAPATDTHLWAASMLQCYPGSSCLPADGLVDDGSRNPRGYPMTVCSWEFPAVVLLYHFSRICLQLPLFLRLLFTHSLTHFVAHSHLAPYRVCGWYCTTTIIPSYEITPGRSYQIVSDPWLLFYV